MVGHAEVDEPRDPNIHLLATLAMFALADYRGAAIEVHGFGNARELPNWDAIYQLYGDLRPYTRQLRALEKYVKTHPSAPDARLLLGFLYLVGGYRDTALKELQVAQKLSPRDRFASQLLRKAGGTVPEMGAEPEQQGSAERPQGAAPPKVGEQSNKSEVRHEEKTAEKQ
jgi:tetratricopeptide (TPR) repeat protein